MKAVTLYQPWASLIAEGIKTIETRSWRPNESLIGERIAIHAGLKRIKYMEMGSDLWRAGQSISDGMIQTLPYGKIVATAILDRVARVQIVDLEQGIVRCGHSPVASDMELFNIDPWGDFSPGRWLWILKDVQKIDPPVEAQGHMSFWNWDDPRC